MPQPLTADNTLDVTPATEASGESASNNNPNAIPSNGDPNPISPRHENASTDQVADEQSTELMESIELGRTQSSGDLEQLLGVLDRKSTRLNSSH